MKTKILCVFSLAILSSGVMAQDMFKALEDYQKTIAKEKPVEKSTTSVDKKSAASTKPNLVTSAGSATPCESKDQSSLPLNHIRSLLLSTNPEIKVEHHPKKEELSISGGKFIANCQSMLEWTLHQAPEPKEYSLEFKFVRDASKCADGKCKYSVSKKVDGNFENVEMSFEPNVKGLQECMKASGVVGEKGEIVPDAIYRDQMEAKFPEISESGPINLLSNGPSAKQLEPKFGYAKQNGCMVYENISDKTIEVLSIADAEKKRLESEKAKVCESGDYRQVADFISKNEAFSAELHSILEAMVVEQAKKTAKKLDDMQKDPKIKLDKEDFAVIGDFDKYVVKPLAAKADAKYLDFASAEGDEKAHKQKELEELVSKMREFNTTPYFKDSHTNFLVVKGEFDAATTLNSSKANLKNRYRLGANEGGVVITPDIAKNAVASNEDDYEAYITTQRSEWAFKTGQKKAVSPQYYAAVEKLTSDTKVRTANYRSEMEYEYSRMQPGGYCYAYYRNTQKCLQDSYQRIQELNLELTALNENDVKTASALTQLADKYKAMEDEGSRYIASQYAGETEVEVSAPSDVPVIPSQSVTPTPRVADAPSAPTNQFSAQQAQLYQMSLQNPNMQGQPQTQQYPYVGQNNYNYTGYANSGNYAGMNWNQTGQQQYMPQYSGMNQQGMGMNAGYNFYIGR